MKFLLTISVFLISTSSLADAQSSSLSQETGGGVRRASTRVLSVLTRSQMREAERRLSESGYWTGAVDGIFDQASREALIAFQKYVGRPTTGQVTLDELEAIRSSVAPKAREVGYTHVEVDLDRQVLLLVNDEGLVKVLPVSTGNDKEFFADGQTSIAYTPRGRFLVYDKGVGWETGPLGSVYYANYISGGVAIHGFRTVPTQPASHGCIRIPMFAARQVSKLMPVGTIVLVYDKASFVSAKDWIENPRLKEAALLNSAATDYIVSPDEAKARSVIKKPRPRIIRT